MDEKQVCAEVQDLKILVTLSMDLNLKTCGIIISQHELVDMNDDVKINVCEFTNSDQNIKIDKSMFQEVFIQYITPILLTVIKTTALSEVHQVFNCMDFMPR